jgi:uncharacterized protein
MHKSRFWWVLVVLIFLLDIYFFQTLQTLTIPLSPSWNTAVVIIYWTVSVFALLLLIALPYMDPNRFKRMGRPKVFAILVGLFFAKLAGSVFFVADDIRRAAEWVFGSRPEEGISRSIALSWAGLITGGGLFGALIYGFGNKYRYQVKKIKLDYAHLPGSFRGLKIVHISDIHSGSFNNKEAVNTGVEKILEQEPDLILFTGDLVNNVAGEMKEYMEIFSKLRAPMGVYSVLGNHDYGDYVRWNTQEEKKENLDRLKQVHHELGWRLLMNEHVALEKDGEKIALLGIENWSSKARFPSYGDLSKAYQGTEQYPFRILMSHDPSHWKAEVCTTYPDIDLMLAGHTHGMQFGFEFPGIRWSPVRYMYKEWAGLYEKAPKQGPAKSQKLYINRGFGFIGYPGRVGILPEITVLELN